MVFVLDKIVIAGLVGLFGVILTTKMDSMEKNKERLEGRHEAVITGKIADFRSHLEEARQAVNDTIPYVTRTGVPIPVDNPTKILKILAAFNQVNVDTRLIAVDASYVRGAENFFHDDLQLNQLCRALIISTESDPIKLEPSLYEVMSKLDFLERELDKDSPSFQMMD